MNHGCPFEAKGFTSGIDESQSLYDLVRERLIHRFPLISVGWLNHQTPLIKWTQPNADLAVRNLIDLGAKAIVMMPIGFATENHETLLDVEHIIEQVSRRHPQVTYVQMPCVNDHPVFLDMVARWAETHIADLMEAEPRRVKPGLAAQVQAAHSPGHSHGPGSSHSHDHHSHDHHSHGSSAGHSHGSSAGHSHGSSADHSHGSSAGHSHGSSAGHSHDHPSHDPGHSHSSHSHSSDTDRTHSH
ncbi:hypothetical protein PROH_08165 [Prochlorothrix hollandica PCC 9006 = CALU 1027]|uniref:Ferrochelatase n=1 Tax=Prochlorothrix hollandica PCC 9006 = CALU 1027 TaxID=317619 RepID=A0A0M2PUN2_PROHO|nr:hypothetical protein PROH_08165 [Prochlorothrix hollandica PCC 9006 = CALU 1027]